MMDRSIIFKITAQQIGYHDVPFVETYRNEKYARAHYEWVLKDLHKDTLPFTIKLEQCVIKDVPDVTKIILAIKGELFSNVTLLKSENTVDGYWN